MSEESTIEERIHRLVNSPDWPLIEQLLYREIDKIENTKINKDLPDATIARNVIAKEMSMEVLMTFLKEINLIKNDEYDKKEKRKPNPFK